MANAAPTPRQPYPARPADRDRGEWDVSQDIQRKTLCAYCRAIVDIPADRSPGVANSAHYDTDLIECWNCPRFRDESWLYGEKRGDGKVWWFKNSQWLEDGVGELAGTVHKTESEDS